jgi:ectoine hydroxylase-related dioxygenase (phytanoyl-CoA dioxygenase family)
MLTPPQIDAFHRNGFLDGGRILDDNAVEALRTDLDRVMQAGPDGFPEEGPRPALFRNLSWNDADRTVWQIVNIWEVAPAFRQLLYHPFIVTAIAQLTGASDLMVWHDQLLYKPPGNGGATRWHQDAPLWPIIRPMTPVSAWVALDDVDEENGCMWMVPGSHRWGDQMAFLRTQVHLKHLDEFPHLRGFTPPADADVTALDPQSRPVKHGEVAFHHCLTWHGSPQNRSTRPRRAIAIHYMTGEARYVASGEHVMKQFVHLEDDAPMREAGAHFPFVYRNGKPLAAPEE